MLHNTGPYGPNDGQINTGAPVNMSQIPGVNNSYNINNLSKGTHQPPQMSTGHYPLPEFANYGQLPPNMSAQMQHFQGYHPMGFHQNFSPQTHPINHSPHWNNGMLPMNLNLHNEHATMESYHQNFEKRHIESSKDQPVNRVPPLNIPQVQTKAFHKQGNITEGYYSESYHNYYDNNLDLRMRSNEKIHLDETRRKSLENTVKLIENILINTTAKRETGKPPSIPTARQTMTNTSNIDYKHVKEPIYNLQQQLSNKQMSNLQDRQMCDLQTSIQTVNTQNILNNRNFYQERNMSIEYLNKAQDTRGIQENKYKDISDNLEIKAHKHFNENNIEEYQVQAIDFASNKYRDDSTTESTNNKSSPPNIRHFAIDKALQENKNLPDDNYTKENELTSGAETSQESVIKCADDSLQSNNTFKGHESSEDVSNTDLKSELTVTRDANNKLLQKVEDFAIFKSSESNLDMQNKINDESTNSEGIFANKLSGKDTENVNTSQSNSEVNKMYSVETCVTSNDSENSESVMDSHEMSKEQDPLDSHESESEDTKPNINELCVIQHEVSHEDVKTEKTYEAGDIGDPFLKDMHGVTRESITLNCDIIDAEKSIAGAKKAIKTDQSPNVYYECPHCNLLLKNPKRFLIHAKWHTFGLTQALKEEVRRQKEIRQRERREARVVENMNSKEITEVANVSGKLYPCIDCDKIFSTKGSMRNHRQRFHPPSARECRVCRIPIAGWGAMRAHMATHIVVAPDGGYQCTECPKKFKYMHSLVKHKGTHMEKTHPCSLCPKMFGSQILLKLHMKSHERMQRGPTYPCSYCGKGFYEAYNLAVHERTHRNERPFSCDICNTSFGTKSSLKRHIKVSHNALKPFECPECHRCFISESIRDRHLQRNHGDPQDFKFRCDLCPCKYLKLKDLQKHEYKVHPKQSQGKRKRKPRKLQKSKTEEDDDMSD